MGRLQRASGHVARALRVATALFAVSVVCLAVAEYRETKQSTTGQHAPR